MPDGSSCADAILMHLAQGRRTPLGRVCGATTRKGGRCKRAAFPLSNSCWQHSIARHPYIAATSTVLGLALGIVGVWMPYSAEVRARESSRTGVAADLHQALRVFDEHLGLVRVLLGEPVFPPEALLDAVRLDRQRMAEKVPPRDQFEIARGQANTTDASWWPAARDFYVHLEEGLAYIRMAFDNTEEVLKASLPRQHDIQAGIQTLVSTIETSYVQLADEAQQVLSLLAGEAEANKAAAALEHLRRAREEPTVVPLPGTSARGTIQSMACLDVEMRWERLDTTDLQGALQLAAQARTFHCGDLTRRLYAEIAARFRGDDVTVRFMQTGLDQLDHPEHYDSGMGLFVMGFATTSAGHMAGLEIGDVILRYDDRVITLSSDLVTVIAEHQEPTASLLIVRDGEKRSLTVQRGPLGAEVQGFGAEWK